MFSSLSKRLKISLAVLLVAAGFMVFRLGMFLKHGVNDAGRSVAVRSAQTKTGQEDNFYQRDSDNDGILDYHEAIYGTAVFNADTDGDGYLDGEEIASGFSPVEKNDNKPGLFEDPNNLTNSFAQKFVAGLYAGAFGTPSENSQDNMAVVGLAVLEEADNKLNPPLNKNLIILTDNSKESQEKYLQDISDLLEGPFLDKFINQSQIMEEAVKLLMANDVEGTRKIFLDLSIVFTSAYTDLQAIPVPPRWQGFHQQLLAAFRKMAIDYRLMAKLDEDPLMASASLSDMYTNLSGMELGVISKLKSLIKGGGLDVPKSQLFELLELL